MDDVHKGRCNNQLAMISSLDGDNISVSSELSLKSPIVCPREESTACRSCYSLKPDLFPIKHKDLVLDEKSIQISFSAIKRSAVSKECEKCGILYCAITSLHENWQAEQAESEDDPELFLDDLTEVDIYIRAGYSLKVILMNFGPQFKGKMGEFMPFEFYAHSPAESGFMPEFGIARDIPTKPDVDYCLALASAWLNNCKEQHPACARERAPALPSRLLDLERSRSAGQIYLRESRDIDCNPIQYMTLSHCWGRKKFTTTTKATVEQRKSGILISELPKTFQDAIALTNGLGVRYLWIDSLCIIQDDLFDWEVESARMASIYAGSHLNLAATQSADGDGGCLADRWTLDTNNQIDLSVEAQVEVISDDDYNGEPYEIIVRHALHVAHDHFTRAADYVSSIPAVSPLLDRAWVFQERVLSPRTLHFHYEELVWECNTSISCECSRLTDYTGGDPDSSLENSRSNQLKTIYSAIVLGNLAQGEILDAWLDVISEYCSLKLTNEQDRLPALAGLASRIAARLRDRYLAGLWPQDLPRALCWDKDAISHPSFRTLDSGVPSWSWASVWLDKNAIISVPHITYHKVLSLGFVVDPRFSIVGTEYSTRSGSNFGICTNASLRVRGALITVRYSDENDRDEIHFGDQVSRIGADCLNAEGRADGVAAVGQLLHCLLIGRSMKEYESLDRSSSGIVSYALILQKLGDEEEEDVYTRIGLLDFRRQKDWWTNATIFSLTIQ